MDMLVAMAQHKQNMLTNGGGILIKGTELVSVYLTPFSFSSD